MYEIIPGILEKSWEEIERKINLVKPFAKSVHVDVLEGKFAPNATFLNPQPFVKYAQDFLLEAHLMVEEPINYLKPFAQAGFKRFLGHVEKMSDQAEFVAQAQLLGEVGLALDGQTPLEKIQVPLSDLDCLLIMTVNAGFSGQKFNEEYFKKIEILKPFGRASDGQVQHDIKIEVDGGINDQTALLVKKKGVTRFVANSFLFDANDPYEQYKLLTEKVRA